MQIFDLDIALKIELYCLEHTTIMVPCHLKKHFSKRLVINRLGKGAYENGSY